MTRGPYSRPIRIHIDLEKELGEIQTAFAHSHNGRTISKQEASRIYYEETRRSLEKRFGL